MYHELYCFSPLLVSTSSPSSTLAVRWLSLTHVRTNTYTHVLTCTCMRTGAHTCSVASQCLLSQHQMPLSVPWRPSHPGHSSAPRPPLLPLCAQSLLQLLKNALHCHAALFFFFFLFLTGMSFPFVLPLPLKSYFSGPFPRTPFWDFFWLLPHSSPAEMITFLFFFCSHRGESRFSLYLTILSKSNLNRRALFSPKYLLMKRLNAQQSWKNFTVNTHFSSILFLLWTLYDTWLYRISIRLSMLSSVC